VPLVLVSAAAMATLLGLTGYLGGLARISDDFHQMLLHDEFRPRRFMAVYGIHLGGYLGGLLGTLWAIGPILFRSRRLEFAASPADS
jgi:hypothetical protein